MYNMLHELLTGHEQACALSPDQDPGSLISNKAPPSAGLAGTMLGLFPTSAISQLLQMDIRSTLTYRRAMWYRFCRLGEKKQSTFLQPNLRLPRALGYSSMISKRPSSSTSLVGPQCS